MTNRISRLGEDPVFEEYLRRLRARFLASEDVPDLLPEKTQHAATESVWEQSWGRSSFPARARRELAAIEAGEMDDVHYFRDFRDLWTNRGHQWISAALLGTEGVGKTVIGSWAGRQEFISGSSAHYIVGLEVGDLVIGRQRDQRMVDRWITLKTTPLLFVDEVGKDLSNSEVSRNRIVHLVKIRNGNDLPTIIASNLGYSELATLIGEPTMDRFEIIHSTIGESRRQR